MNEIKVARSGLKVAPEVEASARLGDFASTRAAEMFSNAAPWDPIGFSLVGCGS